MRRWLQAQGLMTAPVLALFFAAPANFLLNWLLVWGPWEKIRIGFVGAPIATAVSINVMVSSPSHAETSRNRNRGDADNLLFCFENSLSLCWFIRFFTHRERHGVGSIRGCSRDWG